MSHQFRLPDGSRTEDESVFTKAWDPYLDFVRSLDLNVHGYGPGILASDARIKGYSPSVDLPIWLLDRLMHKEK